MEQTFQRRKLEDPNIPAVLPEATVPAYRARLLAAYRRIEAEYKKQHQVNVE